MIGGKRADNKADKLRRLTDTARALFREQGYDATTTREIAQQAGVGIGTLFAYARDKRDLLFLLVNDEFEALADGLGRQAPAGQTTAEQLADLFRAFYEWFAAEPVLGRLVLRELAFYFAGPQAERFVAARALMEQRIREIVTVWQREGRLGSNHDASAFARCTCAIYAAEVRVFLGEESQDIAAGLRLLARMLTVLIDGARPKP